MNQAQELNLADLNFTFDTETTREAAELLAERSADKEYLDDLLRDHRPEAIVDEDQQFARDEIDDWLEYCSLLEAAAIAGHIPAVLPASLKGELLPKLQLASLRTYYEKHYTQRLPTLLRLRLEGRHALSVPADRGDGEISAAAAFVQVADWSVTMRQNDELNSLLALLDDYVFDGASWHDLEELLANPKRYMEQATAESAADDVLTSAALGFHQFLQFCRDFHSLLGQLQPLPLVQSAFWHLFSYWFVRLRGKLGDVVERSLSGVESLVAEIQVDADRGRARADVTNLRRIVSELADGKYRQPIEQAIAQAQRSVSAPHGDKGLPRREPKRRARPAAGGGAKKRARKPVAKAAKATAAGKKTATKKSVAGKAKRKAARRASASKAPRKRRRKRG